MMNVLIMKNYSDLIKILSKKNSFSEEKFLIWKRKIASQTKTSLITNAKLLSLYRQMAKSKEIKANKNLENFLRKRKIRTLSGVAPVAVLTKVYQCPGQCLYCPTEKNMPKSYLSNEPAVMRAKLCDFHPFKQVALRIKALEENGHEADKIELIVMGGTWNYLPAKYRLWYIYACFKAANNPKIKLKIQKSKIKSAIQNAKLKNIEINKTIKLKTINQVTWRDLYNEQKKNETAKHRIVGLTLETRPDYITEKTAWQMRALGCTRVELGVQHLDDKILKLNKRGATTKDTIRATKILRGLGFKITYHLMLNLLGANQKKDFLMFQKIFSDPNFQPDQIKIYPCVVNEYAELYRWWKMKKYKPYTTKQLTALLIKIKKIMPYYVRIIRVIRDIPEESIAAGNKITNLRALLNTSCKCIRCREVGHVIKDQKLKVKSQKLGKIKLFIQKYLAGDGEEYFLSFEATDRKILYAFCRLYLSINKTSITNSYVIRTPFISLFACIRELHTYGQLVPIGAKLKRASQHQGLGQKLLLQAEKIAKENGFKKIAVIAGIGTRKYYQKFGYHLENTYMIKNI
ncbi:MAG TPA: tRNA uridine(34) 5-carboxymethylaminomethyl modification radical SAM/GNAT enzyme Elp3 [bacterium]|nr:tRNA uridine(34) 5-carboxymethylaminomethyl modification radical SAM/GNAT enzyme Elp3 [bacterium]